MAAARHLTLCDECIAVIIPHTHTYVYKTHTHTHTHTQHPDDVIEVRSIQLAESGSFVDQDDEVLDVLEDKEAVRTHLHCFAVTPKSCLCLLCGL